jgi:hypothetical protein
VGKEDTAAGEAKVGDGGRGGGATDQADPELEPHSVGSVRFQNHCRHDQHACACPSINTPGQP